MTTSLLDKITSGIEIKPRRIMLYGTHGIGKSTFGSKSPSPIFIQIEDGIGQIAAHKFPLAELFEDVMESLKVLYEESHKYKTIVVDSLDWLEKLIWAKVCEDHNKKSIEEIGYAKGYVFALTYWRQFLDGLSALRSHKSMACILIAHSKIEKFDDPESDPYDRYSPKLHKHASGLMQEWVDEILFANYEVFTNSEEDGFNRKRIKATGEGERVLKTTERPSHIAKNRLNLPDELPLSWKAYAKHINPKKEEKNGKTKV